jgi:hypothetical protein
MRVQLCPCAKYVVMKIEDIFQIPADTLLAEELASDDVVEMANLTTPQTGVPGTIFIPTAMGGHGPRVKYFLQPGRSQPSFSVTISHAPTVAANSLPVRVVRQMSPTSDKLGFAQQRRIVGLLVSRRHLDPAGGQ